MNTPMQAKEVRIDADPLLLFPASAVDRSAVLIEFCLRLAQNYEMFATVFVQGLAIRGDIRI